MEKNSSPLILMEGALEKLKEREFPWIFPGKKFSTTWVLRYYVLRHANILDQEAFLLEQHVDCTPFSKVHKTLDLRYVVQIDTNISLKVGNQNWVIAIHYKTVNSKRLKVLYLAAHSETEMNIWIMKLDYACKLQKHDENRQLVPGCMNNRYFTDSSMVKSQAVSNIITNNGSCMDSVTTHAYIRSSSASLSSSVASSSTLSENFPIKSSFLTPPPIPPKPSNNLRLQKGEKRVFESGRCVLDQPLAPADIHDLSIKEEEWSNETVRPGVVGFDDTERKFLSFDSSSTPTVSNLSPPTLFPRRRNFRNTPPEVDRSCKPTGFRYIAMNIGRERSNTDDREKELSAASSRFLPTIPSYQQSLNAVALGNKQILKIDLIGQEALYDNESVRTTNDTLDYVDPVREPLAQSQPIKSSQGPKILSATEYTRIDEESTKAVLKANVRQSEMRRNGYSV